MSKTLRIDEISAKCLRGATQATIVSLPPEPITLFFGENGTGKSSLIDAIDLVCCESFGSLAEIGASLKSHLPSLGAKHSDLEARISCGTETWTARLKGKIGVTVTPQDGRPRVVVLRRGQVQKLITATPSDRFNSLKSEIEVGSLDYAEDQLGKAIKQANVSVSSSAKNITDLDTRIADLFKQEKRPDEQELKPLDWLKARSAVDITNAKKEKGSLKKAFDAYSTVETSTTVSENGMLEVTQKRKDEVTVKEELNKILTGNPEVVRVLNGILTETLRYLDKEPQAENCPVCEKPLDDDLRSRIEKRLKSQPELQAKLKAVQDAEKTKKDEEILQANRYRTLVKNGALLIASVPGLPSAFLEKAQSIEKKFPLLTEWNEKAVYEKATQKVQIAEAKSVGESYKEVVTTWNSRHSELEGEIGAAESKKTILKTYQKSLKDGKYWEKVHEKLKAALPIIASSRKQFVQRVLDKLADDCDRIFQKIHPEEQLGGIRFMLDQEKKGSLNQSVDFKGHTGIMPQACLSDSHLDTLSFSFLLAMARQSDSDNTILVIDDIFTSEDDQHLYNIGLLLADESSNFAQIIMATHLRRWLDWIRTGQLPQKTYGIVELSSKWDLDRGIKAKTSKLNQEEIKDLLEEGFLDRTALAGKTRRFLEDFLRSIVIPLGARAPMKPYGDYDLSNYLCGLQSLAKDKWEVLSGKPVSVVAQGSSVARAPSVHETYDIRAKAKEFNDGKSVLNRLVHASDEGAHYTDKELRQFAEETLLLHKYFFCEDCEALVGTKKSARSCICGKWKLDRC